MASIHDVDNDQMFGKNLSVYSSLAEPAVGEVAELVASIRQSIALAWEPAALMLGNMTAAELSRVADLLERLSPPQPVPDPVAWMYQGEPSFDGTDWRETWEVTTDKRLAEFKATPDQPIALFSIPPQRQ